MNQEHRAQVEAQIHAGLSVRLLEPLRALGPELDDVADLAEQRLATIVPRLATYLLQDQDQTVGTGTVIDLAGVTWDDPPAPEWWRTPLGLTVARWAAFDFDAISYGDAARILAVTRGTISQLVARKKLTRHPDGGVVRASVMTRLLQQQSEQPG